MYCVKCGVKLQNGVKECPLCQTPVMILENIDEVQKKLYSEIYPEEKRQAQFITLSVLTAFFAMVSLVTLIICLNLYHEASWSSYVMLGCAMVYTIFCLPFWFKKYHPFIFLPVSFAAVEGYLLFISAYNHGGWFLSFAFPVVGIIALITIGAFALYKYCKRGKLFITGGLLIILGSSLMLVELFQTITFKTKMFTWSLYCLPIFVLFGLFLIIAGIIRPLREYLERKFFF